MTTNTKTKKTYEPIQDIEGEVWRDVPNYEGLYEVSNKGRVKSLRSNKILSQSFSSGYASVALSINNKRKTCRVHHLVFHAFYGWRPTGKMEGDYKKRLVINHKDEDKTNSHLENLEIISQYENLHYGTAQKRLKDSHLLHKIYQYSLNGKLIKIWDSARDCGKKGFHVGHISESCQGIYGRTKDRQVYKGYIWSYEILSTEQCALIASKSQNLRATPEQRKVYQYDLRGNLVKVWENEAECEKQGYLGSKISNCCYGKEKSYKNFLWSFDLLNIGDAVKRAKDVSERFAKYKVKKVYQYTKSLDLIKIWKNQHECKRAGYVQGCISACCRGEKKEYKNYIWSFEPLSNN